MSFAMAAVYRIVMEEVRMDSMMAVQKCTIIVFGRLNFFSCRKRLLCFLGEGAGVQFPLEVLGEDCAQEAVMGVSGGIFFLKSIEL